MIVYRHTPKGFPFLWESDNQPAARWHAAGEGPVHYFADTPDGAWAEFLRHAEVEDDEVERIQRAIWAIELSDQKLSSPKLEHKILTGGERSYAACQAEARRLRDNGVTAMVAQSAALRDGCASGWQVRNGLQPGKPRNGRVIVWFQAPVNATGWLVGISKVPSYVKEIYRPMR